MSIDKEKQQALKKFGHFNSLHEVWGVLDEEFAEFRTEVMRKEGQRNKRRLVHELTQIAAIAQRAIEELEDNKIKYI